MLVAAGSKLHCLHFLRMDCMGCLWAKLGRLFPSERDQNEALRQYEYRSRRSRQQN